jgi:predicted DNA-binding protein
VAQRRWKYPRVCALRLSPEDDQQLTALQQQSGQRRSTILRRALQAFLAQEST